MRAISVFVAAAAVLCGSSAAQSIQERPETRLPIAFVENRGQWSEPARFAVQSGGMTTFVTRDAFVVQVAARSLKTDTLHGVNLFFTFEGAAASADARGLRGLPGHVSYLLGDDPAKWVTAAPTFSEVAVTGLYEGCDLSFHGDRGAVEYDLLLSPGRDPRAIVIRCDGAESLHVDPSGALVARTALGDVRQEAPTTWSVGRDGRRLPVPCSFRLIDERRFGFLVHGFDPSLALVIDPALAFSGYLSGSGADECNAIAVDAAGAVYMTGRTGSSNFPKTAGCFDSSFSGTYEGFVTKINAAGNAMVYSTYLGSPGGDLLEAIVVDGSGQATVTGYGGNGFPVTPGAYDTTYAGWKECVVAKLNATGTGLLFATFVGGGHEDIGNGLAVDASGNVYVAGQTMSTNFPATAGAFDATPNGSWDAFLVKLNPTGSALLFSTLLGGSGIDWAYDVAVASGNEPVVCGGAGSANFPTTPGAADPTPNGSMDAFVAKFNATATGLVFSTVLGSPGNDQALDVALDAGGSVYATGVALPGFPTTPGAYDTTNDNGDAFVAKLPPNGSALVYATFIGGGGTEQGAAIAVDSAGAAYVTGFSNSTNLDTTPSALQPYFGGGGGAGDALVAKVNPSGTALDYCSYHGGAGYDDGRAIAIDGQGGVFVAGSGVSTNLPVTSGPFSSHLGLDEAFFAKFLLTGLSSVDPIGPGCAPSGPTPGLASWNPVLGTTILISGTNAPPGAIGQVYVSTPVQAATLPNGCPVYIDPFVSLMAGSAVANGSGAWQVSVPLPAQPTMTGVEVSVQAVFWTTSSPWGYELSAGLCLTLGS